MKVDADDSGNWAVIAANPHGEMSQFFNFSAQMLPRFEVRLEDHEANEGQQVNNYHAFVYSHISSHIRL